MNKYLKRLGDIPKLNGEVNSLVVASIFSGGGGLDLGLSSAGFSVVFASDLEKAHCETLKSNFKDCVVKQADICNLNGQEICEITHIQEFDLLAGGPPCQAFSILGSRKSFKDPRGGLAFEYVRIVNELRPKAFIFENVPGLLTLNRGKDWERLFQYFKDETGYTIFHRVLNSADFGIPQIRKRLFVVGFKSQNVIFNFPSPTHTSPDIKTAIAKESLERWVPSKYALIGTSKLPNSRVRPHTQQVIDRYSKVLPGERDRVDHTDRIDPSRPSGTVLVGSKCGGGRPFIHPFEHRHITAREAARLQSFPDWYIFSATSTWQYRAIGNAVPPLLAKAVGSQIKIALSNS